jgi:hypothetical protein
MVGDIYLDYYQLNVQHAVLSLMNNLELDLDLDLDLELELNLYLILHQQLCQPAHVPAILVD